MSNNVQYSGTTTVDTSRGPSLGLWADCPVSDILTGEKDGYYFFDDFLSGPLVVAGAEGNAGIYRGFAGAGGTTVGGDEVGGTLLLANTSDSLAVSFRMGCAPFQISRNHGKLWFEARIKSSTITDNTHGFFLGFMNDAAMTATTPLATGSTLDDRSLVGFQRLASDGDMVDTVHRTTGQTAVTVQADAAALVLNTYVKLGIVFNPKDNKLSYYKDGVKLATTHLVSADAPSGTQKFPNDVRLGLVLALANGTPGSGHGNSEIDWWRAAQLTA